MENFVNRRFHGGLHGQVIDSVFRQLAHSNGQRQRLATYSRAGAHGTACQDSR